MRLWPRSRLFQVFLILFLAPILLVIIDQLWVAIDHRITVSPSTTRLTEPLDHGYPDYLAAINAAHSAGVTPDNNAAIHIAQVTGTGEMPAAQINETFRLLGAPPPGQRLFVTSKEWMASQGIAIPAVAGSAISFDGFTIPPTEDDPLFAAEEQARSAPWSAAQHPILSRWLKAMDPAFIRLEEACQKDRYYLPSVTADGHSTGATQFGVMGISFPGLGLHRDLANALMARAMQRLGAGDATGFSRDVLTGARYARLLAQQPSLIEKLVALAIDGIVEKSIQTAATSGQLPPADSLSLYQELDRVGPLPMPSAGIDECERYLLLDTICTVNAGKGDGSVTKSVNTLGKALPINYNSLLRRANGFYDRLKDAFDNPDYAAAKAAIDDVQNQLTAIGSRSTFSKAVHIEDTFLTMFIPGLGRAHLLATANLEERDLALIALQLRAARADNQPFPNSLATLQNIRNDRFTNQPLIYKRQDNGYLLYSLGPNLKDDAGVRDIHFGRGDLSVQATQ